MKKKISITINEKTLNEIDEIIDNIYIRNRSQAIELLVSRALGENKNAVILAGGPEEDLKISDNEYRLTGTINNTTLIESSIKKLKEEGFTNIYIVARHNVITSIFNIIQNGSKYGVNIIYKEETESSGTADSLRLIKGDIKTNFLVVYGDLFFDNINIEELWNSHLKRKGSATLLLNVTHDPSKKGIVKLEGANILEFVQKPKTSDIYLGFASMFIAEPEILEYSGQSLEGNVFPVLAQKELLRGYLSTNKIVKIHSKEDLKSIKQQDL
ncbi:hypothetical protein HOD20_09855 [archaeon]|jgi:NDP-sugar pyrophosphorylase family protein|nr:hypothetical protein [Candidatus Woesearchaeota archaeon]MBT3464449.1 hypothetical protein [archaeon]MBT4352813.1 hypothetical protein [archaeon]MBT4647029.1 hypothetical protein [archaeon]MBT6820938.1 hypothetical protein [archaeon]